MRVTAAANRDESHRDRCERLANTLFERIDAVEEPESGYAFVLQGTTEAFEAAAAFVATGRECCPVFRFELVIAPNEGQIALRLSTPGGTKDLIEHALRSEALARIPYPQD